MMRESRKESLKYLSAQLLSRTEVARILGVAEQTLKLWMAKGEGPPVIHVGRQVRYALSSLNAWLSEHSEFPKQAAQ